MKILITGAQGTVGSDLCRLARDKGYQVSALSRKDLDITDETAVQRVLTDLHPDAVFNAAAYNFVDKVEDPDVYPVAFAINALGPKHLAQTCAKLKIPFVHMSTDFVFDGKKKVYTEDDVPNPLSQYAKTKQAGDDFVKQAGGMYYIARVSRVFGRKGEGENAKESFVDMTLRWAREKPEVNLNIEPENLPTYSLDIAKALLTLVEKKYPIGIYHIVNEGEPVSPYTWSLEIYKTVGIHHPSIHGVSPSFFPAQSAQRPPFSALRNTKFPLLRPRSEALKEFLGL